MAMDTFFYIIFIRSLYDHMGVLGDISTTRDEAQLLIWSSHFVGLHGIAT